VRNVWVKTYSQPTNQPHSLQGAKCLTKQVVPPTQSPQTKGKTVKAGQGSRCAHIAQVLPPAKMQAHYQKISVPATPQGYIKVAQLHKTILAKKHSVPGLTISKMVKAIGSDRAASPPANPIAQPYYLPNRHRVVNGWLATPQGLQAIASGQWDKAPKPPTVKTV
jgi:hypothetical protein